MYGLLWPKRAVKPQFWFFTNSVGLATLAHWVAGRGHRPAARPGPGQTGPEAREAREATRSSALNTVQSRVFQSLG
eukprot:scaffold101026_cov18-Prasinocladus_malaysianus.AAC.2